MPSSRTLAVVICLGTALAVPRGATAQTADGPDPRIAGAWVLNPDLSQDWAPKIDASVGPAQMRGGGGRDNLLPKGGGQGEVKRFRLRQWLEGAAEALQQIEIELEPGEFKVVTTGDDVRIFYTTRKHVRQRDDGTKIEVESMWDGTSLTLLEKTDDGTSFSETYTYDPEHDRLALLVRVEDRQLQQPFQARSVFERALSE